MPAMSVQAIGLGAGTRHTGVGPQRAAAGRRRSRPIWQPTDGSDVVIETNVDDLDPRLWPGVLQRLLDAGASDAWLTPILMKKGRPAHTLHVLVGPNSVVRQQIRNVVLTETSAIGLRETAVAKIALERREYVVQLADQRIRVKVALRRGGTGGQRAARVRRRRRGGRRAGPPGQAGARRGHRRRPHPGPGTTPRFTT